MKYLLRKHKCYFQITNGFTLLYQGVSSNENVDVSNTVKANLKYRKSQLNLVENVF